MSPRARQVDCQSVCDNVFACMLCRDMPAFSLQAHLKVIAQLSPYLSLVVLLSRRSAACPGTSCWRCAACSSLPCWMASPEAAPSPCPSPGQAHSPLQQVYEFVCTLIVPAREYKAALTLAIKICRRASFCLRGHSGCPGHAYRRVMTSGLLSWADR